ncbi:MAG TPA: GIY-YIG nuclease family protein [Nitrososphaeria archaeon]|nr:GIY-YIG nuclease family protein [Nitrososphaeria archaeon]
MRGVYLLQVKILEDIEVEVGKLGSFRFEKGIYVYVGSDQRNVEKRIKRHASKNKKKKWHIDYVTAHDKAAVSAAYIYDLPKTYECEIARIISELGSKMFRGFGSSDCRCPSHFFKIGREFNEIISEISNQIKAQPVSKIEFS